MPNISNFTEKQKAELLALLWNYMKPDPNHHDHVQTGFGTKTKAGLLACIHSIVFEDQP